jgi:hypothetical protein
MPQNLKGTRLRSATWYLTAAAVVLALCPWLWKGIPDAYFPYAGVVVEKGVDSYLGLGGWGLYIVIQDEHGKRSKKYVNHYGYAFAKVGTYVVKKRGLKEYPLPPGEKPPFETLREIENRKVQGQQPNR